MDVLAIFDSSWFGRPVEGEFGLDQTPGLTSHMRRGSVGSLSEWGATEPVSDLTVSAGRERRRASSKQQVAANLTRSSGQRQHNGRTSLDEDGTLGTWAGRQRVYTGHLQGGERDEAERAQQAHQQEQEQQQQAQQQRAQEQAGEAEDVETPEAFVLRPGPALKPVPEHGEQSRGQGRATSPRRAPQASAQTGGPGDSLDQEVAAAWRWRFTRKWQAEQMKQFQPPAAGGEEAEEEEEWNAALRMIDTVGEDGLNMQIGRTLSLHNSSLMENSGEHSMTLMSPGLSQVLLDGSVKESPLRDEAADATSAIVAVARKAQVLRRQQREIERQVNERWEAASGGAQWVAQHLPAVQIDSWSAFPFVLVRLSEPQRSQRQKLVVRGRNGSTEHQAFAATEQEATRASVTNRLPGARIELVASGRIEWVAAAATAPGGQGDRRTLNIRVSRLLPPAAKDVRLHSLSGASAVVAELTRASLQGDFDIVSSETNAREGGRHAGAGAALATK